WDKVEDTKKAMEELKIEWPVILDAQAIPTDLYGISYEYHRSGKARCNGLKTFFSGKCHRFLPGHFVFFQYQ
ncbi:MAG: hypothetical protein IJ968_03445, partial [Clostridia bacterium]|nr:hypothetical protein [Clostridia bacterium]